MATCLRSLNLCLQACSCSVPCLLQTWEPSIVWVTATEGRGTACPWGAVYYRCPDASIPSARRGWLAGCSDHHPNPALLVHSAGHKLHLMEDLPSVVSGHPPQPAIHMRGPGKSLKDHKDREVLFQLYSLSSLRGETLLTLLRQQGMMC